MRLSKHGPRLLTTTKHNGQKANAYHTGFTIGAQPDVSKRQLQPIPCATHQNMHTSYHMIGQTLKRKEWAEGSGFII